MALSKYVFLSGRLGGRSENKSVNTAVRPQKAGRFLENGRSGGIRTHDPQSPRLMRYQAALRSEPWGEPVATYARAAKAWR